MITLLYSKGLELQTLNPTSIHQLRPWKVFSPFSMAHFPRILAHRGARKEAPENTLSAFQKAFELGADGIELDVMCCATGELIVTHDYEVTRLSNGTGKISQLSLNQIKALDFGSSFSSQFSGEQAPTLQEVLEQIPTRSFLNIEIKNDSIRSHGEEPAVASLIQAYNLYERVLVSSFNPFVLRRLRQQDHRIQIGWLYEARPPIYLKPRPVTTLLRPQALHPEFTVVTEDMISAAHKRGYQVNVWTVNDLSDMQRMIAWGVDAIVTDYPDRLVHLKKKQEESKTEKQPNRKTED